MEKATINDFVQARIRKPADGGIPYIEIKRAKYKHWHIIGFHFESDKAFEQALAAGTVAGCRKSLNRQRYLKNK